MRRLLLTAAALLASGGFSAATALPAHADIYTYSGVVVDANGGAPLAGIVVTATPPASAGPSVTVTTGADGTWSFQSDDDEYQLFLDGGSEYQGGYRSCFGYPVPAIGDACTNGPFGGTITTSMWATWASGRIVDSVTGLGVPGAVVEARQVDGTTPIAADTTDADGFYRITGIATDEISLHVDGSSLGYSSGWFGCVGVVPSIGESCTHPPGGQDDRAISPLSAPPVARGASRSPGSITLMVRPPSVGEPIGYLLTCIGPGGTPVSQVYDATLDSHAGFERGWNTCTVRAISTAGLGPASEPFRVRVR